jgi:catechol 2,3-dioxygenase-like lactoylglutathione lyase family enzyme
MAAKVTGLGHVGLFVKDLDKEVWFFRDLLGLQVTDKDDERGMYFFSAQPEDEHHELFLMRRPERASSVQQVSFRCESLTALKEFYRRFEENGIRFNHIVTHGNAIGVYVFDPEDNNVEVYWPTGVKWPQPCAMPMDLTRSDEEILAHLTTGLPPVAATAHN